MNRLGLVLVAMTAASCTRISVEAARYTCDPSVEDPRQCPGDWRCISEGFCVDPDEGGAWRCTDSAQCTNGWQCTREGVCANPAVGESWPCASSLDCTGGWHCGAAGRCYERADAGEVACRRDAGVEDCAPGWTCGLEGRCLDTSRPGFNVCASDLDCFAGQRCADGRCIAPDADALRPGSALAAAVAGAVPLRGARLIAGTADGNGGTTFAGVVGQQLVVLHLVDPQSGGGRARVGFERLPLGAVDPTELAIFEGEKGESPTIVAIGRDGGVQAWSAPDGGPLRGAPLSLGVPMTGVRRLGQKWLRWGFFGPTHVAFGAGPTSLRTSLAPAGAVDLVSLGAASAQLLLSTPGGTFSLRVDPPGVASDAGWSRTLCPKALPNLTWTLVRPAFPSQSTTKTNPTELVAIAQGADGGTTVQHFLAALQGASSLCDLLEIDGELYGPVEPTTLDVSGANGVIAGSDSSSPPLGLSGSVADGGRELAFFGGVDRLRDSWGQGMLVSSANTEQLAALDLQGTAWLQQPNLYRLVPVTPASSPGEVLSDDWHFVRSPRFDWGPQSTSLAQQCVVTSTYAGCVAATVSETAAPVRGSDGWVTYCNEESTSTASYGCAVLDRDGRGVASHVVSSGSSPSSGAAVTALVDGGVLVIGRTLDYLVAGEATLDGGVPLAFTPLRFAVSPLPRGSITDLVVMPQGPSSPSDARYAQVWVIASGRVFRVRAATPALWRSTEVVLATNEELLRVWLDGARARAGDRRGVVFGLDTRLQLSEPLPADERVRRFASRCNNDYALSESGRLYQLTAGPGVLGRWSEVALPVRLERLFEGPRGVHGFTNDGASAWLEGDQCATQP